MICFCNCHNSHPGSLHNDLCLFVFLFDFPHLLVSPSKFQKVSTANADLVLYKILEAQEPVLRRIRALNVKKMHFIFCNDSHAETIVYFVDSIININQTSIDSSLSL